MSSQVPSGAEMGEGEKADDCSPVWYSLAAGVSTNRRGEGHG